jgi:hypothetical protein
MLSFLALHLIAGRAVRRIKAFDMRAAVRESTVLDLALLRRWRRRRDPVSPPSRLAGGLFGL